MRVIVVLSCMCAALFTAGMEQGYAELCNQVVAKVNDHVITLHELHARLRAMTGVAPAELKREDEAAFQRARRQVLESLIDEKITEQKVKELGITVTEGEVDRAIARVKTNNQWTQEDLLASLEKEGLSYDAYREKMKRDLERSELINYEVKSRIIIREERIREYYEAHRDAFTSGGKVHLASIFLLLEDPEDPDEARGLMAKGKEILRRLEGGEDFHSLARRFSRGPGAEEGGDLGVFKADQLDPQLSRICDSLPEGGVSDLIVRPGGIQIIKVLGKEDLKVKGLEQVRDAIYETLYMEEVNRRYRDWIEELRKDSYTEIVF